MDDPAILAEIRRRERERKGNYELARDLTEDMRN